MKKNLFWKIMAVLFFIWLCLWLWNSSIYIYQESAGAIIKSNKLTGAVYAWTLKTQEWTRIKGGGE